MARSSRVLDRNSRIRSLLTRFFDDASRGNFTKDPKTEKAFDILFDTDTWGFREIILVIAVGRLLNPNFKASVNFYDCNPRAIYEGPILAELDQRGIPRRKSGPLNVAKGATELNAQWAAGKEPPEVAAQVVALIPEIEAMSLPGLENFTAALLFRFLGEATSVANLNVVAQPKSDPITLYRVCQRLIDEQPDAGNTLQRIIGYLLQSYHEDLQTGLQVSGHEDRASTTSTTSKKLGDITEEQPDGSPVIAYEITVKSFGAQRVREAYEAIREFDERNETDTKEIIVICRKRDVHPDVAATPSTSVYLGKVEYQDKTFHFVDIYEWVMSQLVRMTSDARFAFYNKLHEYISDRNTKREVKELWGQLQIDLTG
jgi:hypothetical protein